MRALAVVLMAVAWVAPSAADDLEAKRKIYALTEAGPEYCPDIETGWFVQGAIDYDMSATPDEVDKFQAEQKNWFKLFRKAGSRKAVCESLMDMYGPGADLALFSFK